MRTAVVTVTFAQRRGCDVVGMDVAMDIGVAIAASLLVGHMIGHPFEQWSRAIFAREAVAAGNAPDPGIAAAQLMHPLTLRFSDSALEREYRIHAFDESYPTVVTFCCAIVTMALLFTVAMPSMVIIQAVISAFFLIILAARVSMFPREAHRLRQD